MFFMLVFILLPLSLQAKEIRVAVFPFKIYAPQEFYYLKDGLQEMFATRLFVSNNIYIIDKTKVKECLSNFNYPLTEEKVLKIGKTLQADYVIIGSLTILGKKASLDTKIFSIEENKPPKVFYIQTDTLDDLIPKVSILAEKAVDYIQGIPQPSSKKPLVSKTLPSVVTPAPITNPNKMHPDRFFRTRLELESKKSAKKRGSSSQKPESFEEIWKDYKYSDIDSWPDYPPPEKPKNTKQPKPLPPSHPNNQVTYQKKSKVSRPPFEEEASFPDIYH